MGTNQTNWTLSNTRQKSGNSVGIKAKRYSEKAVRMHEEAETRERSSEMWERYHQQRVSWLIDSGRNTRHGNRSWISKMAKGKEFLLLRRQ